MAGPARHEPTAAEASSPPDPPGRGLIRASWVGTAVYVLVAVVATAAPGSAQLALIVVCAGLFVAGTVAFLAAFAIAVGRSREEAIGMGGLFFLAGSAPGAVRNHLLGSFAVEVIVALVSASVGLVVLPADADNLLAFGVLVPLYGLGLAGLWGARFGVFGPRPAPGTARRGPPAGVAGGGEGSG